MNARSILHNRTLAVLAGSALLVTGTYAVAYAGGHDHGKGHGDHGDHGNDHGSQQKYDPDWGIIDRNVIGNGDSYLRTGPSSYPDIEPPFGDGSLGLRTGAGTDKAAFGNQVDFYGDALADVESVGYWVFTTGENRSTSPQNLPNIDVEIDPNVTGGDDYSTLVFTPDDAAANQWTEIDASADDAAGWWLTGAEGGLTGCTQATKCTFQEVKDAAPDATVLTLGIAKGRDYAFSGAVDGLTWDRTTYDFEPFGVGEVHGHGHGHH